MKVDVAVVGAGPSGSLTATLLAQRGARVALIDPSHPREKPCGGGITGRALAMIGPTLDTRAFTSVRINAARFVAARGGADAVVALDRHARPLVVASRAHFDGLLYAAAGSAGAEILVDRLAHLTLSDRRVHLETASGNRLEADFVVGADGANSLVRRRMASAFRRDQLSIATGYFAHGVTSDEIVIEMTADPPGYIWSFPRPDHLAIGICAQADRGITSDALRAIVRDWIARTEIAPGAPLEPYSWPIPSLAARDFASLAFAGPRWLTVGDAAGLVDPITREGIFFALQSAQFAADALSSAPGDATRIFAEDVRREIGRELVRAARYKAGFFRPAFTRLLVDALRSSPRVRAVMADLVAGVQGYKDLKWRLAGTLELGLAWRMLTAGAE